MKKKAHLFLEWQPRSVMCYFSGRRMETVNIEELKRKKNQKEKAWLVAVGMQGTNIHFTPVIATLLTRPLTTTT